MNENELLNIIAVSLGFTKEEIKSQSRKRELCNARHIAILMMRNFTRLTLEQIGTLMNRHHSTVINSIYKAKIYRDNEKDFRRKIFKVKYAVDIYYRDKRIFNMDSGERSRIRHSFVKRNRIVDKMKKARKVMFITKSIHNFKWVRT